MNQLLRFSKICDSTNQRQLKLIVMQKTMQRKSYICLKRVKAADSYGNYYGILASNSVVQKCVILKL